MPTISATQFLRPNGEQRHVTIDVDNEIHAKWVEMRRLGGRITLEQVPGGLVSICIEQPKVDDFDIELVANAPDKPKEGLEALLNRFDPEQFKAWQRDLATDGESEP